MPSSRYEPVFNSLRVLFRVGSMVGRTDEELLDWFVDRDDEVAEAAFSALVERHGPMVLRVCRSMFRDPNDAQDAFQATFLVLARKAGSIARPEALGTWLHGVALRVSNNLKAAQRRREVHERQGAALRPEAIENDPSKTSTTDPEILHEEIARLPERYRRVIVLCYLEGHTYESAAHLLSWRVGTVKSRLARAKDRLRRRLIQRGLAPSAAMAVLGGSSRLASAGVPPLLSEKTVRAALAFAAGRAVSSLGTGSVAVVAAHEVLRSMAMNTLWKSLAALVILGGTVTAWAVGSAWSGGQGDEPAVEVAEASVGVPSDQEDAEGAPIPETIEVMVVDGETEEPIPRATIRAYISPGERHVSSDAEGRATVPGPRSRRYELVLDIWAEGYQAKRFWFSNRGDNPLIEPIPENEPIRFALDKGELTVGGQVVDEAGNPIPGVEVEMSGLREGETAVAFFGIKTMTDAEGRWSSSSMPANLSQFNARFRHPEYVLDTIWQQLDLEKVKDQSQVTTLTAGVPVRGRVLDQMGQPIAGAKIKQPRRVGVSGADEAETDAEGRFAFPGGFEPGSSKTLLAFAPEHAPELVELRFEPELDALEIRLESGRTIHGRVIDPHGQPIVDAGVIAETWRNWAWQENLMIRTDVNGRFTWEGAPEDGVTLRVGAYGYKDESISVTPGETEDVWTLKPTLSVQVRVHDAVTDEPIKRFELLQGRVDPETGEVIWNKPQRGLGQTQLFGRGSTTLDTDTPAWRLKILAQGYQPLETRDIAYDEGRVRLDVKLAPLEFGEGGGPSGVVVDEEGNPVEGAEVMLATASQGAQLTPGGSWWYGQGLLAWSGAGTIITDAEGRFTFLPTEEHYVLGAVHPERGYAEVDRDALAQTGRVVLKPWARIDGQVVVDGKPVPGAGVGVHTDRPPLIFHGYVNFSDQTLCDDEGRFAFERVPPVLLRISIGVDSKLIDQLDRQIAPGETVQLVVGEPEQPLGRTVVGRLVLPEGVVRPIDVSRASSPTMRSEQPWIPAPEGLSGEEREPWIMDWWPTAEARAHRRAHAGRSLSIGADGTFRVENVLPGNYRLTATFQEPVPGDRPITVATLDYRFMVPEGPDDEPFELGEIPITLREPPNVVPVGEPAPNFEAVTVEGQPLSLEQFQDKYILLDFWATWCGPCIEEMPWLKAVHDRFGQDARFVLVSLSLDDEIEQVERFLEDRDQPWVQGFLGTWSDNPVTKAYGVEAIPSIWLIGPGGKVVAKNLRGDGIAAAVAGALSRDVAPED